MPKTSSGGSRGGRRKPAEAEERPVLAPVMDAMRAHPIATAAAVAAGGIAVARLARRGRTDGVVVAESAGGGAKASGTAGRKAKPSGATGKTRAAPAKRAAGGGLTRKVTPDAQLAAVVGGEAVTRADLTKRLWDYIKKNGLQDASNRRMINADDRLRPIFGKDQVSMFDMTRLVSQHVA
jgi:upstream activation factor subunit UAF30